MQLNLSKREKVYIMTTMILTLIFGFSGMLQVPIYENGEQKVDPAIVSVETPSSRGTGFFIEENDTKYLVTAAHVCGTSDFLISVKGLHRVITSIPSKDICIATTYQEVNTLKLAAKDPQAGDAVDMTGFPGNLIYDYQKGSSGGVEPALFKIPYGAYELNVACPKYTYDNNDGTCLVAITTIRIAILARPGNSGGPVQNEAGEVVGILVGTDYKNGFMVPVSELHGVIQGRQ